MIPWDMTELSIANVMFPAVCALTAFGLAIATKGRIPATNAACFVFISILPIRLMRLNIARARVPPKFSPKNVKQKRSNLSPAARLQHTNKQVEKQGNS